MTDRLGQRGDGDVVYVATHQALLEVEDLPGSQHHACGLGLLNSAITAPMVLAPALAWLGVTKLGGTSGLFPVCSLLILASNFPLLRCDSFVFRCQHARA